MPYIELDNPAEIRRVLPGSVVDLGVLAGGTLGIIVYDKERHEAYAGHFIDAIADQCEKLVERALATFQRPGAVEVYVVGASVDILDDLCANAIVAGRRHVEDVLHKYGFHPDQTYIRWSPSESEACFRLDVDTEENELQITSHGFHKRLYKGDIRKAPTAFVDRRSLN